MAGVAHEFEKDGLGRCDLHLAVMQSAECHVAVEHPAGRHSIGYDAHSGAEGVCRTQTWASQPAITKSWAFRSPIASAIMSAAENADL